MTLEGFIGRLMYYSGATPAFIELGCIDSISDPKRSPLDILGFPGMDADEQETMDNEGAFYEFNISGEYVGDDWAEVIAWKESIQRLINGLQYDNSLMGGNVWLLVYYPDYPGYSNDLWYVRHNISLPMDSASNTGVHVMLESFEPMGHSGEQPAIKYSMKMIQQLLM
jgi:hypothetical protein